MVARIAQALVAKYGEKADATTLSVTLFDPDGNVVDPADRAAIRFARFHWTGWRLPSPYTDEKTSTTDYVIESAGGTVKWSIAITTLSATGQVVAAKADGELTPTVATFLTRLAAKL